MSKSQAEKQKAYRERKRNEKVTRDGNGNAPTVTVTPEGNAPEGVTDPHGMPGPLTVYSEPRWIFLQSRGHTWQPGLQRSTRPGPNGTSIIGVTVPGDPAYEGVVQRDIDPCDCKDCVEVRARQQPDLAQHVGV